ncbi:MAG: DNA repair protein RadC [Clostridiales bacterium]|nr:DNA repair protein RadC [Clostridiales bacterium]
MKISELHPSVRPYERLESYGAESLSDEELLAIVIRSGTKGKSSKDIASQLLSNIDNPDGLCGLYKLTLKELADQEGVGRVKAIVLKACLELGRRSYMRYGSQSRIRLLTSDVASGYFEEKMAFLETEEVHVALLDNQQSLISHHVICKGSVNGVGLCFRELFRMAVKANATGLILAHNHPSGDPTPSEEDIETTLNLKKSGELIGISVVDHIIIGRGISFSMLKNGLMEEK